MGAAARWRGSAACAPTRCPSRVALHAAMCPFQCTSWHPRKQQRAWRRVEEALGSGNRFAAAGAGGLQKACQQGFASQPKLGTM